MFSAAPWQRRQRRALQRVDGRAGGHLLYRSLLACCPTALLSVATPLTTRCQITDSAAINCKVISNCLESLRLFDNLSQECSKQPPLSHHTLSKLCLFYKTGARAREFFIAAVIMGNIIGLFFVLHCTTVPVCLYAYVLPTQRGEFLTQTEKDGK